MLTTTMSKTVSSTTQVLLQDTFTDTNGTALAAHTMNVGSGWTAVSSTYTIQSNRARPAAAAGIDVIAVADAGNATVTVKLDVVVPASGNMSSGTILRFSDANNFWRCQMQSDNNGASAYLYIADMVAGVATVRASQTFAVAPAGTTVTLTVVASGNSITLSANTGDSCNFSSSFNATATKHGLYAFTDGTPYVVTDVDNFLVTG